MKTLCRALTLLTLGSALFCLTGCPPAPPAGGDAPKAEGKDAPPAKGGEPKKEATNSSGAGMKQNWGDPSGIVIGSYMSLTGDTATFGQSSTMAMGMAVEEINAKGGVGGSKKLALVVEDDASKTDEATSAATRLVTVKQAAVIVGEVASSRSIAAAPTFQAAGIPMLSPSSTNPKVTQMGDCIFRSCYTDDQQGAYIATFAAKKGWKKGAILKDVNSDYSKGLTEVIQREFGKGDRTIDTVEAYTAGNPEFGPVLTKIKELKPEVIFVPGYYGDVALIVKKARELGITAALIGGDGWDSPKLVEIAGANLDKDCYFVNHYAMSDPRPKVQAFVSEFKKRYNEDPDALAACAYDAIYIVAAAIEKAGGVEKVALKKAIGETKDFDGVTGKITIDGNRNASKSCVVLTFKDGKQVVADTITPADLKS